MMRKIMTERNLIGRKGLGGMRASTITGKISSVSVWINFFFEKKETEYDALKAKRNSVRDLVGININEYNASKLLNLLEYREERGGVKRMLFEGKEFAEYEEGYFSSGWVLKISKSNARYMKFETMIEDITKRVKKSRSKTMSDTNAEIRSAIRELEDGKNVLRKHKPEFYKDIRIENNELFYKDKRLARKYGPKAQKSGWNYLKEVSRDPKLKEFKKETYLGDMKYRGSPNVIVEKSASIDISEPVVENVVDIATQKRLIELEEKSKNLEAEKNKLLESNNIIRYDITELNIKLRNQNLR